MSTESIIEVENLSKQYRLGEVSTGTVAHDLNRWWSRMRGKADPTLRVTAANNRAQVSGQDDEFVWALKDIEFEVKRGEVLGIIGRNGAGKSTLLKILSRITAPTAGEIRVNGRIASLLEVGTGFHPELTGRENIFLNGSILGMSKAEIHGKLDEIVDFSGCARYLDTPVKRYSSGMVVRLGFAVAAHLEPEILIVDEVLAVGDTEFQRKCIGKMKDVASQGRTVLFVSHNMTAIKSLCQSAILIGQGLLVKRGDVGEVVDDYLTSSVSHSLTIRKEDHQVRTLLQIESISFGTDPLESMSVISQSDPVVIRLCVRNSHAEARCFKCALELLSGGECFSTLMSPEISISAGDTRTLLCAIPAGIIRPNMISVTAGLICLKNHRMADLLSNIASSVISPPDDSEGFDRHLSRGRGSVYLPSTWE